MYLNSKYVQESTVLTRHYSPNRRRTKTEISMDRVLDLRTYLHEQARASCDNGGTASSVSTELIVGVS